MTKSIVKLSLREIARTWNRFLSIVVIIALGAAFYTGLKAVGPDMNATATRYFSDTNMMDYKLLSTLGFTNEDMSALSALPGVTGTEAGYALDALLEDGDDSRGVRVISLPDAEGGINRLSIQEGRLPENGSECVVDSSRRNAGLAPGDTIKLVSGTVEALGEKLTETEYTVVGIVNAPDYLTRDRGASTVGNGKATGLVYVPRTNFMLEYYTELHATVEGSREVFAFGPDYEALAREWDETLKGLAARQETVRSEEIADEAGTTLTEKKAELDSAEADAQRELADAQAKLDDAGRQLEDAVTELSDARAEADRAFSDADAQMSSSEAALTERRRECEASRAEYAQQAQAAQEAFALAQSQLDGAYAQLALQEAAVMALKDQLEQGIADGTLTQQQIEALQRQIDQSVAAVDEARAKTRAAEEDLAAQKQQLADAGARLDSAGSELDAAEAALRDKKTELADEKAEAERKFLDAETEIEQKRGELADAQAELDAAGKDADLKLADARAQLEEAEQSLRDLPEPRWVVLGRDDNAGYADFGAAMSRTDGLSAVFPLFFFLIAALVCLTTMTRMVDEQRTQLGTMKALGYGRGAIAFKYLFYAGVAGVLGTALGLAAGFLLIPRVIMLAYDKLYSLPELLVTFRTGDAAAAAGMALGATVAAALLTCWRELAAVPAALMRPQAPKAGKRVLLERVGFVWTRLSFSRKVTVRNLLRYQKRFWMTVLGVACCCGLLLTGLGLKDSVATQVSDRQFGELFLYDLSFQVKEELDPAEAAAVDGALASAGASWTALLTESVTAAAGGGSEKCALMAPSDPGAFDNYIILRDPETAAPLALPDSGAVLTEKLAEMLEVTPGDTVTVTDGGNTQATVTVAAVAENYLSHFVMMSPPAYEQAFGQEAVANQRMVNLPEGTTEADRLALATELNALDGAGGLRFQQDNIDEFHDVIRSLDYIVWVIILAAAALAFAVLYTLTSINISERFREIATLKVLGFYDRETAAYVFRESYILTLLGIAAGLALGVALHGLVLDSIEVDAVMFVRQILPRSYLIGGALTLVFTWIVNRLALGRLSRINMVEALKDVE